MKSIKTIATPDTLLAFFVLGVAYSLSRPHGPCAALVAVGHVSRFVQALSVPLILWSLVMAVMTVVQIFCCFAVLALNLLLGDDVATPRDRNHGTAV